MAKQKIQCWVSVVVSIALIAASAPAQSKADGTLQTPQDGAPSRSALNRCGANSVFVASALLGQAIPLSRCVEVVPVRRAGNTMIELKQGFERLGFAVDAVAVRSGGLSGLQGTFVVWIPPGMEIRTESGDRLIAGHFVVLHHSEGGKWTLLDYPVSAHTIEPETWLAAVLSEYDLAEAPMLIVKGKPKGKYLTPLEVQDSAYERESLGTSIVQQSFAEIKTSDNLGLTPQKSQVETDIILDDAGLSLYRTVLDFGSRRQGEQLAGRVLIWNALGVPTELTNVQSTCGCTVSVLDQSVLQPGEGAVLEVSMDLAGRVGQVRQSVSMLAKIKGRDIPIFVECLAGSERQWTIQPRGIAFGSVPASGGSVQQVVTVRAAFPDIAARLLLARSRSSQISARVQKSGSTPDAGVYSVLVTFTPDGLFQGYFAGEVHLFGTDDITAEVTIPVTAKVE